MKALSLTVAFLILALVAFRSSLSRERSSQPPRKVHDYLNAEPFRGAQVGKTIAQACGNCHSNQTNWPWYAHVMPVSWWIENHVRDGREALNFSEWATYSARQRRDELELLCGMISNGRMPPASYKLLHPEARLRARDKQAICTWAANDIGRER
jgi:hypothetical protein